MLLIITVVLFCWFLGLLFLPKINGRNYLPKKGPVIIVANHYSFWDPIFLSFCLWPRPVYYMAKAELFKNPVAGWFLRGFNAFPVKRGTADLYAVKKALSVLSEGKLLGIFPEGTRGDGDMQVLNAFEPGTSLFALRSQAAVVPAYIHGAYGRSRISLNFGPQVDLSRYHKMKVTQDVLYSATNEIFNSVDALRREVLKI